jgi:hypothetical protein
MCGIPGICHRSAAGASRTLGGGIQGFEHFRRPPEPAVLELVHADNDADFFESVQGALLAPVVQAYLGGSITLGVPVPGVPGTALPVGWWLDVPITRFHRPSLQEITYLMPVVSPGFSASTCAYSGKSLLSLSSTVAGSQPLAELIRRWASGRTLTKTSGTSFSTCSTDPEAAAATTFLANDSLVDRSGWVGSAPQATTDSADRSTSAPMLKQRRTRVNPTPESYMTLTISHHSARATLRTMLHPSLLEADHHSKRRRFDTQFGQTSGQSRNSIVSNPPIGHRYPSTEIHWTRRRGSPVNPFGASRQYIL